MVSYLCKVAGVSRSGYYNYFSKKSQMNREQRENEDLVLKENILKAFYFKRRYKGARQIKMTLEKHFNIQYNLKRIRRIMKKYNIICPIRQASPYKKMKKASKEHRIVPNLLNREFKQNLPGKVLLTDITYLYYKSGKLAYLSTIKDGSTNEILAYNVSDKISTELVIDTLKKLERNKHMKLAADVLIHSDQGIHYTSNIFQKYIKEINIRQSMSRKGNCWDNAPQESFFGHMKDEINIKECSSLDDVRKEITSYIKYYNYYRCQWGLKKMTPVEYRNHLLNLA